MKNTHPTFAIIFAGIKSLLIAAVVILYLHYFFPQSWGFYTIDSNIPLYDIYRVNNGQAEKSSLIVNNMSYGMGLSRKGKLLYNELYSITENKNLVWKPLNEDSLFFITGNKNFTFIPANKEYGTLKGEFLLVKTLRPSYEALKKGQKTRVAKQYILARIR